MRKGQAKNFALALANLCRTFDVVVQGGTCEAMYIYSAKHPSFPGRPADRYRTDKVDEGGEGAVYVLDPQWDDPDA